MDEKKIKMSMVKKFPVAKTNGAHADVHVIATFYLVSQTAFFFLPNSWVEECCCVDGQKMWRDSTVVSSSFVLRRVRVCIDKSARERKCCHYRQQNSMVEMIN